MSGEDEWFVAQYQVSDHEFLRAVSSVARLTAVDGAVVVDDRLSVFGFGAKIGIPAASPSVLNPVPQTLPDLFAGREAREGSWGGLGGTRHLSAAHFVAENSEAVALIVSVDGPTKLITWIDDPLPRRIGVYGDLELLT